MSASGQTVLDLGPFPGVSDAEFTLTGLTGIADDSEVEAWVEPSTTTAGFEADGYPFVALPSPLMRGANLNGIVASKLGIFSAFVSMDPVTPFIYIFSGSAVGNGEVLVSMTPGGNAAVQIRGATGVDVNLAGPIRPLPPLAHVLASWDIGANVGWLYFNDVLLDSAINRAADEVIDYTLSLDWGVGGIVGSQVMKGVLAEVYFSPGQYLDFSVLANRRKFNQIVGDLVLPVSLGSDGSLPTGTVPIVYQRLDRGEAASAFKTNRGTGGNFTHPAAVTPSFGIPLLIQSGHSIDEHVVDPPNARAYSPSAAGASMKIKLSARDGVPVVDPISNRGRVVSTGNSPLICGKWNVGWGWN